MSRLINTLAACSLVTSCAEAAPTTQSSVDPVDEYHSLLVEIADQFPQEPNVFYSGLGAGVRMYCEIPGDSELLEEYRNRLNTEGQVLFDRGMNAAAEVSLGKVYRVCELLPVVMNAPVIDVKV